ncbi:MAG: 1,2-phenylacetyl-CoA epoxidase, subunit C [uncultured Nocardioides sp.]|uniref:1,2-phenylacetyl-CoA epoxidase, subunit C n=1 Tax=uncultured Nocardioides sp. TaxID=198441 RepID=A0A6J4P8V9_9ACTN|nr:MAG: 1,2-phenylacetyl-CoA epoxidase, subunit C [uncultured Nocardioides sp.]
MDDSHDSVYDGLLVNDAHWAFGTDFEDPLAGVDTTIPEGTDAAVLGRYALALGDDALVMSHRLAEWCSNAPDLEEDIALANIALDLLGQARLLLARAAKADESLVPALPEGSPVPAEDALAFFREAHDLLNVRLAELPRGDFAEVVTRVLLFSVWRLAVWEQLRGSRDAVLAAVAAKGVKELAYHRDFAARWFVTLAQGTPESRRRLDAAVASLWPLWPELFDTHAADREAAASGVGVDPATVRAGAEATLDQVLDAAGMERPEVARMAAVRGRTGRDGLHTEALSRMLAEMQSVARAHPQGTW